MSQNIPDAWDAEWTADTTEIPVEPVEPKKAAGKVSKAQKRAQQAEFNRQIWQQAEGPQETNYFLESRNIVPLRSEFKPPPILLSRKGPSTKALKPPTSGLNGLSIQGHESSSDDEDATQQPTLAERQAQAAKDREQKQRKYEERRQELFGPAGSTNTTSNGKPSSGKSSPANLTPPTSRSATPNRGRGNGRGRGRSGGTNQQSRPQSQGGLFEPSYAPKPESIYLQRRENGTSRPGDSDIRPERTPRGPDGSGRGGFGFTARGGGATAAIQIPEPAPDTT